MRPLALAIWFLFAGAACVQAATMTPEAPSPAGGGNLPQLTPAPTPAQPTGRFQLVVVPGHPGSPFLLDTTTGCTWHQVQHQETKRTTFVEVDVENLHWSWGSGAQQLLARRVDNSNLNDEQKRAMKQELQKTACGLTNIVLTPGSRPAGGAGAPTGPAGTSPGQ